MLKARQCADGRKQQEYMLTEESISPTVTTEAIFITSIIDANKKQEVAVVDLWGAFLDADKGTKNVVCQSPESIILYVKKCVFILQEVGRRSRIYGVRNKTIWPMCSKQDSKWPADDNN